MSKSNKGSGIWQSAIVLLVGVGLALFGNLVGLGVVLWTGVIFAIVGLVWLSFELMIK